jgi:hypothetical protein
MSRDFRIESRCGRRNKRESVTAKRVPLERLTLTDTSRKGLKSQLPRGGFGKQSIPGGFFKYVFPFGICESLFLRKRVFFD